MEQRLPNIKQLSITEISEKNYELLEYFSRTFKRWFHSISLKLNRNYLSFQADEKKNDWSL